MMDGFFTPQERQQLFDTVVLSGGVQMAKPDRAIFELTCERLGVTLNEAVMIDDMQTTRDIVKTFGMQIVCYKSFEQCKAELDAILTSQWKSGKKACIIVLSRFLCKMTRAECCCSFEGQT